MLEEIEFDHALSSQFHFLNVAFAGIVEQEITRGNHGQCAQKFHPSRGRIQTALYQMAGPLASGNGIGEQIKNAPFTDFFGNGVDLFGQFVNIVL